MRQISFRCSDQFYTRFQEEKRARCLSTQELAQQAMEDFFNRADHIRNSSAARVEIPVSQFWATPEDESFVKELFRVANEFPGRKRELILETLALDAKYYQSARLKGTRFEPRFSDTGFSSDPAEGRED